MSILLVLGIGALVLLLAGKAMAEEVPVPKEKVPTVPPKEIPTEVPTKPPPTIIRTELTEWRWDEAAKIWREYHSVGIMGGKPTGRTSTTTPKGTPGPATIFRYKPRSYGGIVLKEIK